MLKWLKKTALWIVAVPLLTLCLGAGLNQIVLLANHDRFPVTLSAAKLFERRIALEMRAGKDEALIADPKADPDMREIAEDDLVYTQIRIIELENGMIDNTHCVATSETHLNWLADWVDLQDAIYSPGDGMIYLGEWALQYAPIIWIATVVGKLARKEE